MHARLKAMTVRSSDDGLSLVEVLVAMMIFSMLVVGIGYSMISILQMTRDNQTRETATSLASSELDNVRALGDPFAVDDEVSIRTVGTNTYTISRKAGWASPGGNVDTCGASGGPLRYKSVSVKVTWAGMMNSDAAVFADTALVPAKRINDPTKGTLLISIKDSIGLGLPAATFTVTPIGGGPSLTTTPTDSDGCSYLLKVTPGTYTVVLTNSNYIDNTQDLSPSAQSVVTAGKSSLVPPFQYDKKSKYVIKYASNDVAPGAVKLPTNMHTTFFNTNGIFYTDNQATQNFLFPYTNGYEIVAGNLVPPSGGGALQCSSVDPATWEPNAAPPGAVGTRAQTSYAAPGQTAPQVGIPMGIVEVSGGPQQALYAVSQTGLDVVGQPVCDKIMDYSFGKILSTNTSTKVKIALPFGTWRLYTSTNVGGARSLVPLSRITVTAPGAFVSPDGAFVLDPRGVTP